MDSVDEWRQRAEKAHAEAIKAIDVLHDKRREAEAELDNLRTVLAEVYQVLGALDAPVNVLDQVTAALNGDPLPHESLLPFTADPLTYCECGDKFTAADRGQCVNCAILLADCGRRVAEAVAAERAACAQICEEVALK